MRALKSFVARTRRSDDLLTQAEKIKNRDWVEFLEVIHPAQAARARDEYLLSRLQADWASLTTPLLANHSLPTRVAYSKIFVACDHNTFANELSLIRRLVAAKIEKAYGVSLTIEPRATKQVQWKTLETASSANVQTANEINIATQNKMNRPGMNPTNLTKLIEEMTAYENTRN